MMSVAIGCNVIPTNFRTHKFYLFGINLTIGGMAGPHNNEYRHEALKSLKANDNRTVLIGLHEENFSADAHAAGLEYYHFPIPDFAINTLDPALYDAIYMVVKKATEEGKSVSIHCGAGNGRTGTALASLKLRELLETAAKKNPLILDEYQGNTSSVHTPISGKVPCTPLVKAAVESIRDAREIGYGENGSESVETISDINTLIAYERHLRVIIKQALEAQHKLNTWSGLWRNTTKLFKLILNWTSSTPENNEPRDKAFSSTLNSMGVVSRELSKGGDNKTRRPLVKDTIIDFDVPDRVIPGKEKMVSEKNNTTGDFIIDIPKEDDSQFHP